MKIIKCTIGAYISDRYSLRLGRSLDSIYIVPSANRSQRLPSCYSPNNHHFLDHGPYFKKYLEYLYTFVIDCAAFVQSTTVCRCGWVYCLLNTDDICYKRITEDVDDL